MQRLAGLFLAIGVIALVVMIRHVGWDVLVAGMKDVGWAFALVCGFHLLSITMDATAIRLAAGEPGSRVRLWPIVKASLAGHGINVATPGGQVGEVVKYVMLRDNLGVHGAAASLIVVGLVRFIVSTTVFGILLFVAIYALDPGDKMTTLLSLAGLTYFAMCVGVILLMRSPPAEGMFRLLRKLRVPARAVENFRGWWVQVESHARHATRDQVRWRRLLAALLVSVFGMLAQDVIILYALGVPKPLGVALVSAGAGQLVMWLTSFVPLQVGTAEGGAMLLFKGLGLPGPTGVVLELVKKCRKAVFLLLAIVLLGGQTFAQLVARRKNVEEALGLDPPPAP